MGKAQQVQKEVKVGKPQKQYKEYGSDWSDAYWYFRQLFGFFLAVISILCAIFFYGRIEEELNKTYLILGSLAVALVGLVFHETRPFKRLERYRGVYERVQEEVADAQQQAATGKKTQ